MKFLIGQINAHNIIARTMGNMISENRTALHPARGTSPESLSEGWPKRFFL